MSVPISTCLVLKAAKGDACAFDVLVSRFKNYKKFGSMSVFPCKCIPPCEDATEEQMTTLDNRVKEAMRSKTSSSNGYG